uniref:Uncharacterized protein n=1 Tax=Moniliophthora roreri TaxID=221103 RepID=A0A0W0F6F7_MONRR
MPPPNVMEVAARERLVQLTCFTRGGRGFLPHYDMHAWVIDNVFQIHGNLN